MKANGRQYDDLIPGGILVYHADKMDIISSSKPTWDLFDCDSEEEFDEFSGGSLLNLIDHDDLDGFKMTMRCAHKDGFAPQHHIYYRVRTRLGKAKLVEDRGKVTRIAGGADEVASILMEVDGDSRDSDGSNDKLTYLVNKRLFLANADSLLRKADAKGRSCDYRFVFFNIAGFKMYNLEYSTTAGDRVLVKLARILTSFFKSDYVSRFSNDHFCVLSDLMDCIDRAQRVVRQFDDLYGSRGIHLKVGIYQVQRTGEFAASAADLAKAANDSIRRSFEPIKLFDALLARQLETEGYVARGIEGAIAQNYIRVYYQPVVRSMSGKLCGLEALARWVDPVYGFISPAEFVPALEKCNKIHLLDTCIINKVCQEMHDMTPAGKGYVPVSVNLSRYDFAACDMVEVVEQALAKYNIARDMINVEVTESAVISNSNLVHQEIDRFHAAGYQVWMDDFGSAYSSLNVLKDYDFDELKLDMEFVRGLGEKSKKIVKAVVSMAKDLGLQTLTEGVETREQFEFLKGIGCEKVQGYLFGRPMEGYGVIARCAMDGVAVEGRNWRNHFDRMGRIDFVNAGPLAIVDYDGERFSILQHNERFLKVWERVGVASLDALLDRINAPAANIGEKLRNLVGATLGEDAASLEVTVAEERLRVVVRKLSACSGHTAFTMKVANITQREE